jgi:endoglucanase
MENLMLNKMNQIYSFALAILYCLTVSLSCSKDVPKVTIPPTEPPVIVDPKPIPEINANATTAKEIIQDMAAGFNLGNVFDNGINASLVSTNKAIIDLYYTAGMRHVRIPTTWMDGFSINLADESGNVNTSNPRFAELKETIDYALAKKMYVVLNTHHEHWLKKNYDGSEKYDIRFTQLWKSIATIFKDYPKQLLFEIINEPEGTLGQWSGGGFPLPTGSQQLEWTRKVNKVGYDAIRATGGNNTTRVVMVAPNGQGNQGMIEEVYPTKASLPGEGSDNYLAIQVHTYDPWAFCGQTGTLGAYPGNATIENAVKKVGIHSVLLDVPINYGEFGVGRQNNTSERNTDVVRGYYKLMASTCKSQNMSFTPWDDRGWFGLINGSGTNFSFTNNIVPSMMAQ